MSERTEFLQKKRIAQAALIILAGFLVVKLHYFIDALLGAVIVYMVTRKLMRKLIRNPKMPVPLAATIILILTTLFFTVPIAITIDVVLPRVIALTTDTAYLTQVITDADNKLFEVTGRHLLSAENVLAFQGNVAGWVTGFAGSTLALLGDVLMMYFVLYFLLVNTGTMEKILEDNLPFSQENIKKFAAELELQTYSNALGAPILAILQSCVAVGGFLLFGVKDAVFWGIMCGIFSFFPVVGSALIWGPPAILRLVEGNYASGIGLFLFGIVVISTIDNVFRFILQKKMANVHPLITILGVILGLQNFGLPGIIFGPLLISYFILLLKIYSEEFKKENNPAFEIKPKVLEIEKEG